MFHAPDPEHFAAVGRSVESSWDLGRRGRVAEWISDYEFVVEWEQGIDTVCTVHDVEPAD